ncbi:low molecular weight protein arginine phosphatase [Christensenellaceae bacterium NSJ-44]|uniref:Low molecular weight protein arginine phosphatase n=1 Tax=Luoshenia tenuis TaxID=2763654 RepID=A0A926CZ18_9FIRM|nr:low molecular weight protein arginine phosphatase [Luoshenia tenuis]MBC8528728.1 low molecular weight protein arginine phosphatase [Luoshenia tenuis]
MEILFICTGNTCRSPMAAALLGAQLLPGVTAASAGISAFPGEEANPYAVEAMKRRGIDLSDHEAKQVTREMIERAHLVICMEQGQAEVLRDAFEEADLDRKIYSFREFFCGSTKDIPDPYGGDEQVYENCAVLLEKYIKKFVKKILMQE